MDDDKSAAAGPSNPAASPTGADDARTRKITALRARNDALKAEVAAAEARLQAVADTLRSPARETVKTHIRWLHEYNEIRDVGQGLMGMVADNRGVRVREVYKEFGVAGAD